MKTIIIIGILFFLASLIFIVIYHNLIKGRKNPTGTPPETPDRKQP